MGKALICEFVGTFALIFVGAGSILVDSATGGQVGLIGIALAHGLTIAVMASATGLISGGHLNPAVTFGALLANKVGRAKALGYWIAQLAGAAVGAYLLKQVFSTQTIEAVKLGTPMLGAPLLAAHSLKAAAWAGILVEAVLTFLLVFVVFGTGVDERFGFRLGGLAIGLTVTLDILMGGPLTGAAMNPARTFGPALAGGYWTDHAVYWIGPLAGGGFAGLLWRSWLRAPAK